jgi:AcrR family transcriptional regulator
VSPQEARARAARAKRRPRLSKDAIVDVALRIVDTEGVDEVSMRRVAAAFDTGPASLYAYFANKDELLHSVLDRVIDSIPSLTGADWREVVRGYARSVRETFAGHRDIAKLTFAHIPAGEGSLAKAEHLLGVMIEGGVPPRVASWAIDIVSLYIGAATYEDYLAGQRFAGDDLAADMVSDFVSTLNSSSAFPYLARHIDVLTSGTPEERFDFGLEMLIAGIAAQAGPRR